MKLYQVNYDAKERSLTKGSTWYDVSEYVTVAANNGEQAITRAKRYILQRKNQTTFHDDELGRKVTETLVQSHFKLVALKELANIDI